MARQPGDRIGAYEILSPIGSGGMGVVYRAHDMRLGRTVAIKLAAPNGPDADGRQLIREAQHASALNHPNICTIHEVGETADGPFIVMEYVDGEPLNALIRRGALSVDRAARVAIQIVDALAHAHAHGVVHRDLKPANVVITGDGRAKVLDFGLARRTWHDGNPYSATMPATEAGTIVGTVAYMAPEVLRGTVADAQSDIWSLGVMLYELVAGATPFPGRTEFEVSAKIFGGAPVMPRHVPATLAAVILRCLTSDRSQRYRHIDEVRAALKAAAAADGPPPLAAAGPNPRWLATVAGAVILMLLVGGAFTSQRLRRRPPASTMEAERITSIVVVPTRVFGAPEFEYLTDAVPATLSTHLAQIPGLDTKVPPTSTQVQAFKDDVARIANAYGVRGCVVSSITAFGVTLNLNVQLVDPQANRVIWSDEYSGTRDTYLELIGRASLGLRRALQPHGGATPVLNAPSDATATESEIELRRGQYYDNLFNNRRHAEDFDTAIAALNRAVALNPRSAVAAAAMAWAYHHHFETLLDPSDLKAATTWSDKAIAIDARSGEGWAARAWAIARSQRTPDLSTVLESALKAAYYEPRCAQCQFALMLQNSTTLALAIAREATRLEPFYLYPEIVTALSLRNLGRNTEALTSIDEVLNAEPNLAYALWTRAMILAALGRVDEAAHLADRFEQQVVEQRWPRWPYVFVVREAVALTRRDFASADQLFNTTTELKTKTAFESGELALLIQPLVRAGQLDRALDILKRTAAFDDYDALMLNRELQPLRDDARFRSASSVSRAMFERESVIIDRARTRAEFPTYLERPLADVRNALHMDAR